MEAIRVRQLDEHPHARQLVERAKKFYDAEVPDVTVVKLFILDFNLSKEELRRIKKDIFVDPVIERSLDSYESGSWHERYDWFVQVGLKPGVKDGEGERAKKIIEEVLNRSVDGGVYTAWEYHVAGDITKSDLNGLVHSFLANELINRVSIYRPRKLSDVRSKLNSVPRVTERRESGISFFDLDELNEINERRNLALSEGDINAIGNYFSSPEVKKLRIGEGLPPRISDVELEIIAQTQSEHCKHRIFNAKIDYRNEETRLSQQIDSLMDSYIKRATEEIDKEGVLSTFWDNAGVVDFNDDYALVMKFETHNSPSAKDPYGGALTGIVGVYRDPMGTGKGSRIIAGAYGFCTGDPFYEGPLQPEMSPRRLLEGIVEGVRDGGNKSGIPTITGYSYYDNSFLGKPLVYVGALGLMPKEIGGKQGWRKTARPGDKFVMVGGRVGRDGIHGVTESSLEFGDHITANHVQIGDPYTQKKVQDFIVEARDRGLFKLVWDLGGGGLSSAVGETATFSGGCELNLEKVPLKYEGLSPWEIMVSESQERMLLGAEPRYWDDLCRLADKHDVEMSCVGEFTSTGKFHVKYKDETVAYLDLDFLHDGFPDYELQAVWDPPQRQTTILPQPEEMSDVLLQVLSSPNIASKEWIQLQYDYEVQGSSVIKPLVGKEPVKSDGSVISPLEDSDRGVALGLSNDFPYSQIDPFWMAANTLEESIRRVVAVGADPGSIVLNDNFCWPNCLFEPEENPQGRENLGKLVRAVKGLYRFTKEFGTPCISGKDSMFIDGWVEDKEGEVHRVSGLPALQFSAMGQVGDIHNCVNLVPKARGDLVYLLGLTKDELGGSQYWKLNGKVGNVVPRVDPELANELFLIVAKAIRKGLIQSCHGSYRGGLGVALAEMAIAAQVGLTIDLDRVPRSDVSRPDKLLFSETPSRFVVTVRPDHKQRFEDLISNFPGNQIGIVEGDGLNIVDDRGIAVCDVEVKRLSESYKGTFEEF